jgi:glutamine synthetase
MLDSERELAKLGVPVKTRHNEVAPNQYELAPVFEGTNVGCDHQMLTMQVMQNTARDYGLVCLLHEKPFAGVNGSGKHNNWSMGTDTGDNLLEPGDTPGREPVVPVLRRRGDRGGGHLPGAAARVDREPRPGSPARRERGAAGDHLDLPRQRTRGDLLGDRRRQGRARPSRARSSASARPVLPPLPLHSGDRNRTSPFAFTGNKFEFRALGSSMSPSWPNTVLNTIVAEAIDNLAERARGPAEGWREPREGDPGDRQGLLQGHRRVVFNGDNYSESWHKEAEKRGLANLRSTPDALPWLIEKSTVGLFKKYKVLSKRELESRYEVYTEQYSTKLNIEAETAASIARTLLLPAALRHLAELKEAGVESLIAETDELVDKLRRARSTHSSRSTPSTRRRGHRARALHARHGAAGDGRRARRSPTARADRRRRPLAAAEVLGDALHQVAQGPQSVPGRAGQPCHEFVKVGSARC